MSILISYRRDDSSGYAGRIYDRLSKHFGDEVVFMDIDTIQPGQDFVETIERAVASSSVLIALIGPQWLTITDSDGRRRLDDPDDFVRVEIATALARGILVIPVLVAGAQMPGASELPEALVDLARRQAIEISDSRFHYDVNALIEAVEELVPTTRRQRLPVLGYSILGIGSIGILVVIGFFAGRNFFSPLGDPGTATEGLLPSETARPDFTTTPTPTEGVPPDPTSGPSLTPVPSLTGTPTQMATKTPSVTPSRTLSPTPTAEPPEELPDTDVLFMDDFSTNANGWSVGQRSSESSDGVWTLGDGTYQLTMISKSNAARWAFVPHMSVENFQLEFDARFVSSSGNFSSGHPAVRVTFRETDDGFYHLYLDDDAFRFRRYEGGEWISIVDWTKSSAVQLGNGSTGTFTVLADGSSFAFYSNGSLLDLVTDTNIQGPGKISIGGALFAADQSVTVEFENLVVREAP